MNDKIDSTLNEDKTKRRKDYGMKEEGERWINEGDEVEEEGRGE